MHPGLVFVGAFYPLDSGAIMSARRGLERAVGWAAFVHGFALPASIRSVAAAPVGQNQCKIRAINGAIIIEVGGGTQSGVAPAGKQLAEIGAADLAIMVEVARAAMFGDVVSAEILMVPVDVPRNPVTDHRISDGDI